MITWLVHDYGITGAGFVELPSSAPPASETTVGEQDSRSKIVRRRVSGSQVAAPAPPDPPEQRFPQAS